MNAEKILIVEDESELPEAAVRAANPDFLGEFYSVKLAANTDPGRFVQDMQPVLGSSYNIHTVAESGTINFSGLAQNMALVAAVLSAIFMVVGFVIIFNTTLMRIYTDKKSYGIFKALGMTPLQIRLSLVWNVLALSAAGALAGTFPSPWFCLPAYWGCC